MDVQLVMEEGSKNLRFPESHFSDFKKSNKKAVNFAQVKVHIPTM